MEGHVGGAVPLSPSDDKTPPRPALGPLKVQVKNATYWKGDNPPHPRGVYKMEKSIRGQALIINNERFVTLSDREGSSVDAANLKELFEGLGFKVTVLTDMAYGSLKEIESFAEMKEHEDAEMCVVAIMSHGSHGSFVTTDNVSITIDWVLKLFAHDKCPALRGKPKFFVLQACRGVQRDKVSGSTDADPVAFVRRDSTTTSALDPSFKDMLIAYSTIQGYLAHRDRKYGTWFVESLCRVFMEKACTDDIRDMLDEVSEEIQRYEAHDGAKQSCSYEVVHFFRKLYFNPGLSRVAAGDA